MSHIKEAVRDVSVVSSCPGLSLGFPSRFGYTRVYDCVITMVSCGLLESAKEKVDHFNRAVSTKASQAQSRPVPDLSPSLELDAF